MFENAKHAYCLFPWSTAMHQVIKRTQIALKCEEKTFMNNLARLRRQLMKMSLKQVFLLKVFQPYCVFHLVSLQIFQNCSTM